jgi:hypothetical protein
MVSGHLERALKHCRSIDLSYDLVLSEVSGATEIGDLVEQPQELGS